MDKIHFKSESNEWSTPQEFFDRLNAEFDFHLDVAATKKNTKCQYYYTLQDDAISKDWSRANECRALNTVKSEDNDLILKAPCEYNQTVWCNPPYGKAQKDFIRKAHFEFLTYNTKTVLLIPARTDTRMWGDFIFKYASEIRFITGRLKFGGCKDPAPFPSAVVIFGTRKYGEIPIISTMKAKV